MKVVQINTFPYKATGHIMMNLHKAMTEKGIDSYVVWGRGRAPVGDHEYKMTNSLDVALHGIYTRLFDRTAFASYFATKKLIRWLSNIRPDIIHLHCVHGYYINIKLLFNYIRQNNIRVIWTQHDCWTFTGHCAYFDAINCQKWKTGCHKCPQLNTYPKSYTDNSKKNWSDKKKLYAGLNIQFITPCEWLKTKMEQSFLKDFPIKVIYNGIDLHTFKRTTIEEGKKRINFKQKMILGVASEWTERKGLKDFILLDQVINHKEYQIFLVGLTEDQQKKIPSTIKSVKRTNDVNELVDIYSAAYVFFNPTYEDNFPTTNLEAIACGTPVITYRTGGSPESIQKTDCGFVVEKGNIEDVLKSLNDLQKKKFNFSNRDFFSVERMLAAYEVTYVS